MSTAMSIRFGLVPLTEVHPWGKDSELHWFGLTQGWYCLDVGGFELMRYSDRSIEQLCGDGANLSGAEHVGDEERYIDYYVVRLWEDILALFPEALEPVPADLIDFLRSDSGQWSQEVLDASIDDDGLAREVDAAITLRSHRFVDTGYLRFGPSFLWWRTVDGADDRMTIEWWYPVDPDGVIEFVRPPVDRATIPTSEFLAAVNEFDRALLSAMEERVSRLEASGPPEGVKLDGAGLRREHGDRMQWLPKALERPISTDWNAVRSGARALL
ncbi:DUF5984 family protein [Nocardia sp. NBC_00403]|uniref:DUF5984 family protein n=1 Tax=Nocardia sp. NBC_00403 TaxID=2975990 RepID=UPI002E23BE6A